MSNLQRLLVIASLAFLTTGMAGSLMDELSDKTVAQLLDLLESPNSRMRIGAAASIEYRYLKPGRIQINPPTYKEQRPEFPLPPQVVPRLADHLKWDWDYRVRIEAARALCALRSCTNTTPFVVRGLDDTNSYVRVWTCNALIDISRDYRECIGTRVIPTLKECLGVDNPEEPTWIAAWISGQLGDAGQLVLPELKSLAKYHKSSKVRHYAREAMKAIERKKRSAG